MNKVLFSSKSEEWETPQNLFDLLNKEFNFTVDVASNDENYKVKKHYTKIDDGLKKDWKNEIVWCNPPYGKHIDEWIKKAYDESKKSKTIIVMLIPARTDTKWFHEYIYNKQEIRFIKGRLKFGNSKNCAPFPSMIVIFKNRGE